MAGAQRSKTQTEVFWRDEYEVTESDLDLITSLVLETGKPQPLAKLVSTLITTRFQREAEAAARQVDGDQSFYRPIDEHQVGQELVFSALDFAVGRVEAVRSGYNPKYGSFSVLEVALDKGASRREFAAGFDHPHPLNRPVEELLSITDSEMSEEDMVQRFEHYVALKLEPALEAHGDFVLFSGLWFLKGLLPEIHVGYLNLAEAMIYEARRPLAAHEMLSDLDLGTTGSTDAQLFALNHALREDERFDNVSMSEEPVWYLRGLEPEALFERPQPLKPAFRALGGEQIGLTMLDMVDEIGDELDDVETMVLREMSQVRVELSFPHLYAGTMPLTLCLLRTLPATSVHHFPITLVDSRSGQGLDVWVVPEERYVCGLGDWYAGLGMCIGGQITITPTDAPLTFNVATAKARSKRREWIRSASVGDEGLVLQMQQASSTVRCDKNMFIDVADREEVARLMAETEEEQPSLSALIHLAFLELAKLSSRGIVHAKSIYSMINMLRRTGAVPVFAELTRSACYDPVGDGFWAYDASLEKEIYRTPVEMRERSLSNREDLVKDQVVEYLGR
jgi:hypothetical protein